MKVHLLFLVPSLGGGGAERVVVTLLRHLDRERFRVSLAVVDMTGAVYLGDLPSDVELIDLQSRRVRGAAGRIVSTIWRLHPDIVFSTLGHLNLALAALKTFLPSGVFFVARETTVASRLPSAFQLPAWWSWAYRRLYHRFDTIVCQSAEMRTDLIEHFCVPGRKTVVINNPVDVERIARLRCEGAVEITGATRSHMGLRLVAAGSMTPVKGFDLLFEALELCRELDYHLMLLGDGPLLGELRQLAANKGLSARVSFLGFRKNPYPYLAAADCFVLSSLFEGFPNVVLESLACGTPVIALPSPGGIREIAATVGGCTLAENCSAAALARTIMDFGRGKRVSPGILMPYTVASIVAQYENLFMTTAGRAAA